MGMPPPRILICGFEPFGECSENISEKVARIFQGKSILGREVDVEILSVSLSGSVMPKNKISQISYDAILLMGVALNSEVPRIESRAQDKLDFSIPDNGGRIEKDIPISGDGDLFSVVDLEGWNLKVLPSSPILSSDAGTYLCNETYYRTLQVSNKIPCLFLHLPPWEQTEELASLATQCIVRMLSKKYIDVAAGVIINSTSFLAAKRKYGDLHQGKWEFPGGKIEFSESIHEALKRELYEELEVEISIGDFLGVWYHEYEEVTVVLHVHTCDLLTDEFCLHSHDEIRWCRGEEDLDWIGSNHLIIPSIIDHLHANV